MPLELVTESLVSGSHEGILGWAAKARPSTSHVLPGAPSSVAPLPPFGVGSLGVASDPISLLAGTEAHLDTSIARVSGARGAASYELLRRMFMRSPGLYAALVRRNMQASEERYPGDPDAEEVSAWDFVHDRFQLGNQRTLTFCSLGFAHIFDMCRSRRWELVEDATARLLVATEQAAMDSSQWQIAWPLTFLREPQWTRLQNRANSDNLATPQFGQLSDPSWTATVLAYLKEASAIQELRRRAGGQPRKPGGKGDKGKGGGKGGQQD